MPKEQGGSTSLAFTHGLVEYLRHIQAEEASIADAKRLLRQRRDLRNEPSDRKGYEYVVEILLRPTITKYGQGELGINSDLHRRIYSSHFHTTDDEPTEWATRWQDFKRAYPDVDTNDNGHRRRADLFIAVDAGIVSIEFKYLHPKRNAAAEACVTQIRQHLTKHRAAILVLYAATPTFAALDSSVAKIRNELPRDKGFVVTILGPCIEFP